MSLVDFKKWPCRPVEFNGQGPHHRLGALFHMTIFISDYNQIAEASMWMVIRRKKTPVDIYYYHPWYIV